MYYYREYQKDNPDDNLSNKSTSSPEHNQIDDVAQPASLPASTSLPAKRLSFAAGDDPNDESNESMDMAEDDVTAAFLPLASTSSKSQPSLLLDEEEPSFAEADESAMDLVANPSELTSAFARNPVLQRSQALGTGAEYEVPLGAAGVHQDDSQDVVFGQSGSDQDDDTGSTMEMETSMELDQTDVHQAGVVITDGKTSRRVSTSGAIRRGSLAPGLKALAMLDATEEIEEDEDEEEEADPFVQHKSPEQQMQVESESDDDRTVDMEETAVFSQSQSQSQAQAQQASSKPRFSLSTSAIASQSPGRSTGPRPSLLPLKQFPSQIPLPIRQPTEVSGVTPTQPSLADRALDDSGALNNASQPRSLAIGLEGAADADEAVKLHLDGVQEVRNSPDPTRASN